jgi:hypothetical protein
MFSAYLEAMPRCTDDDVKTCSLASFEGHLKKISRILSSEEPEA